MISRLSPLQLTSTAWGAGTAADIVGMMNPEQSVAEWGGGMVGSTLGSLAAVPIAENIQDSVFPRTSVQKNLAILAALGIPITSQLIGQKIAGALFPDSNNPKN